ncbi:hypothetical protein VP01_52g7 [Puccinia sorghi]|uniref:Uncharacterized protein n=1 Tax=Puccinia sorghi TaxID=27349 RepID=A0A0L6UKC0_9BASI|nr:hypothetical protein VP01_52g7 [Puccinia sorghi]
MSNAKNKPSQTTNNFKTTEAIQTMAKIDLIYLKLAINAIPTLTLDNFSIWHTQILHYLDHLSLKDFFVESKGKISASDTQNVRTVLTSKMDATVHANVITHTNKNDTLLIWKSINKYFASQHTANHARVWNQFSCLAFNNSDVLGFITKTKAAIEQLHKVAAITPDLVLDHLRLHANQLAIDASAQSSATGQKQVSLFTDASKKCKYKAHNTLANHPKSRCWKLYPHLRPLPPSSTIITYILREVQQASVMNRRQEMRKQGKDSINIQQPVSRNIQPTKFQPATTTPPMDWAKQMEELSRKVEAFTAQKSLPPHMVTGTAPGNPVSFREPMRCFYCFQLNHGTARCSVLSLDESKGAVKRIGKGFFLPENSQMSLRSAVTLGHSE